MNTGFAPSHSRAIIPSTLGIANRAGRECWFWACFFDKIVLNRSSKVKQRYCLVCLVTFGLLTFLR